MKFSTEKLTYNEAVSSCSGLSGRLIEIHNSNASKILAEEAATAFGVEKPDFWIGINDEQDHGS